ncbi:hypothetical protein Q5H92_08855 [Hymenobacter sp. M29]|uniref:Uncharacterized protein n=1 Tax=Hymenobacter mellowenesis TaxID=3063995 RepID=A0ABT9A9E7_9BACT|nr:hypothetical protein [Hymenobacter sp. M29]MDO7846464.1 hypothetical protein [Hymenobacter sp. M29]
MCNTKTPQLAAGAEPLENPLAIVAEVVSDWLLEEGISSRMVTEEQAAALFMMLGTAGYSIVPNAMLPGAAARQNNYIPCGQCGACAAHEPCSVL